MIKINLIAEKKAAKAPSTFKIEGAGGAKNAILVVVVLLGFVITFGWWWMLDSRIDQLNQDHIQADNELRRLEEIRKKGEEYKVRKELLARKIDLIRNLKKQQEVPVHILDQVSKNLPDFLWLDRMSANNNAINIVGKATTYNAVSNFYKNLTSSSYFDNVTLGKTFEVQEGVSFSLTCTFVSPQDASEQSQG